MSKMRGMSRQDLPLSPFQDPHTLSVEITEEHLTNILEAKTDKRLKLEMIMTTYAHVLIWSPLNILLEDVMKGQMDKLDMDIRIIYAKNKS